MKLFKSLALAVLLWAAPAQAQIFHDTFTGAANTIITAHTPDIGTSWTAVFAAADGTDCTSFGGSHPNGIMGIDADGVSVRACAVASLGSSMYSADATYTSANYSVAATFNAFSAGGAQRSLNLFCRIQDANNFVVAMIIDSTDTHDTELYKVVGGTATELSSTEDTNWTAGDVAKLVCNGTSFSVQKNDVNVITDKTAADAGIQAAGKAGLGAGDITGNTGFASTSGTRVTTFTVTSLDATVSKRNIVIID